MKVNQVDKNQAKLRVKNLASAFEIHYKYKISNDLIDKSIRLAEFALTQPDSQTLLYLIIDQGLVMAAIQEMEKAKTESQTPEPEVDYEGVMSRPNNSIN